MGHHPAAQGDEILMPKVGLGIVGAPGADHEIVAALRAGNMIDRGQQRETGLVSRPAKAGSQLNYLTRRREDAKRSGPDATSSRLCVFA